jgi:hypothetical protein
MRNAQRGFATPWRVGPPALDTADHTGLRDEQETRGEMMRRPMTSLAAVLAMVVVCSAASRAADAPVIGTWSLDPANCKAGQESENAPLVITREGYDQHESHCTFKSVEAKDGDTNITSECMVEGGAMPYDFTLTVSGDTLTFTDSGGPRDFLRCK